MSKQSSFSDLYNSEFETDSETERKRTKRNDLAVPKKKCRGALPSKDVFQDELSRHEGSRQRLQTVVFNAFDRHKMMVNNYLQYYGGKASYFERDSSKDKTDFDIIREHGRFLWSSEDDHAEWESQLAKKYYDRLFKEYAICNLDRYKEGKVAMRWRTEEEVINGRGQFSCGNKKCVETDALKSWEVNFKYLEKGEARSALVKVRLCPECSIKLNFKHAHKEKSKEKSVSSKKVQNQQRDLLPEADVIADGKPDGANSSNHLDLLEAGTGIPSSTSKVVNSEPVAANVWTAPLEIIDDKKKGEDAMDAYLNDLFM